MPARRRGIGVAPVDAVIVAAGAEDSLRLRAGPQERQIARRLARPLDKLVGLVDGELRARAVVEFDLVLRAVAGADAPGDVAQRPRIDVQIVGQGGLHEGHRHMDARILEFVDAARGQDLDRFLRERRRGFRLRAHQAVGLAVDADQADQRVVVPRPVFRGRIVQPVGFRPDAEKRIVGDQRNRGRTEIGPRRFRDPKVGDQRGLWQAAQAET